MRTTERPRNRDSDRSRQVAVARLAEISRPTGAGARDLRDRLLRRYQAGGSRWSSLDCFAGDLGLDAGDVYRLVCQTECSLRLREAILAWERGAA